MDFSTIENKKGVRRNPEDTFQLAVFHANLSIALTQDAIEILAKIGNPAINVAVHTHHAFLAVATPLRFSSRPRLLTYSTL